MIKAEVVLTLRVVFHFRLAGGIQNWYALLISFSPTTHPAAHHRIQADALLEGNTWTFNLMKRMESSQASVHLHGYMDSFGCKDETGPGQGKVQCCCLQLLCVGEKTKIHKGTFNWYMKDFWVTLKQGVLTSVSLQQGDKEIREHYVTLSVTVKVAVTWADHENSTSIFSSKNVSFWKIRDGQTLEGVDLDEDMLVGEETRGSFPGKSLCPCDLGARAGSLGLGKGYFEKGFQLMPNGL